MTYISIDQLDNLFQSYNYDVSKSSTNEVRIYTMRYGMYHAAEIVKLNENFDVIEFQKEFSNLGYATEIKTFTNEDDIEEYLFEGFFIKTPLGNELKKRYNKFVNKQLIHLPEGSSYEYINSSYTLLLQNEEGSISENKLYETNKDISILENINRLITNSIGSIFIIIEAPAGFGKTCTAYEILNNFSINHSKKLPFFSELSRNRQARIFKHILLNEIDEQFPIGIKKNIVIDQITKGRIPLIIDGFDELISKESTKEEVESMLSTILELLNGNAKIIVTTRKTALFSSEEFFKTVDKSKNKFSIARFEIKEPTIENWLCNERIKIITSNNFPINYIENPVLLSYLRNIPISKFVDYLLNDSEISLIDKYIDYLLKREQRRQNIKLTVEEQLIIFTDLARLMVEFDITAESKDFVKEFMDEYNNKIIRKSLDKYIADEKPSYDDLLETISNHVFLDRKQNDKIGFVNDFIFGVLIAEDLVNENFQKLYPNYNKIISSNIAYKALQAFKIQNDDKKLKLWYQFNNSNNKFEYEIEFFFYLDYFFTKNLNRFYENLVIEGLIINDINFDKLSIFSQSVFSHITFKECFFDLSIFKNCTFQNCIFIDCSIIPTDCKLSFNDFAIFACDDNNGFLEKISERIVHNKDDFKILTDFKVLNIFFNNKKNKPIPRKIQYLKSILNKYSTAQINKQVTFLKKNGHLYFKDDICIVSEKGVNYYQKLKKSVS